MKLLVDQNIEGQASLIQGTIESGGWTELISIDWVTFSQAGLPEDSDDRVVWRFAQQGAMILLTANRRMIGDDSLEQVIREETEPDSMPVVTISDAKRVIEPEYRQRCALRLLEIAEDLVNVLGTVGPEAKMTMDVGRFQALPILALGLAVLPAALGAELPPGFEKAWAGIEEAHRVTMEEGKIVGGSLMFLHEGEVVAKRFHGFADLESKRAVDEDTIYHWASITKTLTGIAVLQLRDRGLLDLDAPLTDYLPELGRIHNPHGDMDAITLSQALSHSAGFRTSTWPWGGAKKWHPHEPRSWEQLVAMFPYSEVYFEPGSKFAYSNLGIVFLGRIIELVTGDDYEVYVDKNILKPLGMHRSYFDVTPYHLLPHRSNNYALFLGKPKPNGLDFDTGITVSNGGLNAPLTDMAKYLSFLMGDPERRAAYDRILRRESLEEMWQIRHAIGEEGPLESSMGWAFFLLEQGGRRFVGHTGSQKNFMAFVYVRPESRTGTIFAVNTSGDDTRQRMNAFRSRLFDEVFPLFEP